MAQEPFIQPPQTETSVRQAFEDYIQSKKIEAEGKGQTWAAEKKYRTSLKLIEDAGIVLDNMSLKELNTEENIERVMTNERLLKGEKTVRGDVKFGKGNIRDLGNHLNTIFNNLRAGEANALASWNAKNKGKPNPNSKGPFKTLGFALTERDIPGQIKTAPDAVMLKAFRDTLDDIQDVQVGKTTIPAKTVKAHMLMSVITGMRSPDINNFVSQIDPSEEQLKATDSIKTFLRSDDKVMVINNKGKLTEYALNPTLYSILSDATQSASGEKVFPSAGSIEKSYLGILQDKLTQAGYPNVKQNVKGVLKDVPLSHNVLRKFAFSFVERIPEAEGGGTSNADALIQHKTKDRSIGETTYRAGTLGEFQTTKETTAQSAFLRRLLPDTTTPAQFLEQQGFNPANFVSELYSPESDADMQALGSRMKTTVAELAAYETYLDDLGVSPETQTRLQSLAPTREAFDRLMQGFSPEGVIEPEDIDQALEAMERQRASTPVQTGPSETPKVKPEQAAPEISYPFTDTSDAPDVDRDTLRKSTGDFLKGLAKKAPAVLGGAAGITATAIEESFAATPASFATLDPVEEIRGTPTSELSDTELLERMQTASSQRLSPDMAERTTALADIEANREGLAARAFDAPSRMRAEQADLTELDPTTPELERMRLAETLQDVDIDASEIDSMEARKARIAAQAAQIFNRRN